MGNDLTVDVSELLELADDLDQARDRIGPAVQPAVKRGAQNIKTQAARSAEILFGGGAARRYPRSITYDITADNQAVVAEIGPDKDLPQGALGNLLEYGSSKNPPYPHLVPAAEAEYPRAQVQITKAALRAMLG